MDRHFDAELQQLNTDLLQMAALVETAIADSVVALKNRDLKLAQTVIDNDEQIDELELVIEERAIALLALRQPLAIDLRFITTGMKINAELERIADLSVNIAERAIEIADLPMLAPLIDIPKLSEIARKMVKGSIDAFVQRNEGLAKEVILAEPQADNLRNLVQSELVTEYLGKDCTTAYRAVPLLLVARHLERMCDHATNIAEDVI